MPIRIGFLLGSLPVAAVVALLSPPSAAAPAAPPQIATEEERACTQKGTRLGSERVVRPWTLIGVIAEDVEAHFCVLRGDPDSPTAWERDADRVVFALVGDIDEQRDERVEFEIRTVTRRIHLGPAPIRVLPKGARSCRPEICQAFTDPGDHVVEVFAHAH